MSTDRKSRYSSSRRTDAAIRKAFAELISERKSIDRISVVDLAERAGITRGTFYMHYNNIYDVASDLDDALTETILRDADEIRTAADLKAHIARIFTFLRKNEQLYRKLSQSDEPLKFVTSLGNKMRGTLICEVRRYGKPTPKAELDAAFYADGFTLMIMRYFRGEIGMTLDDIEWYFNQKIDELFAAK